MIYVTNFTLTCPVNNLIEAKEYLVADNMEQYLPDGLKKKVATVKWILETEDKGIILVHTNVPLSEKELNVLSEWVISQHSDGIGEGFSGQDFAVKWEEDEVSDVATFSNGDYVFKEYNNVI